ncbi:MAG: O-antigen ligase family protein, partial [Acidiferrobacterales bacterium]
MIARASGGLTRVSTHWREKAVYALLFMLPVAGVSVRHWISGSFALLTLLSLPELFKRKHNLRREERWFVLICAAFFAVFLLSSLFNGWTDVQTRFLGREIRFLFAIPIYLMVRRYPDTGVWLLRGALLGAFVLCAQSLLDVYVFSQGRATGAYSPNLLGPVAVLLAFYLLCAWKLEKHRVLRALIPVAVLASLVSVALSGSRGAYLGLAVLSVVWIALSFRGRYTALAGAAVVGMIVVAFNLSHTLVERTSMALAEFKAHMQAENPAMLEGQFTRCYEYDPAEYPVHAAMYAAALAECLRRLGPVGARIEMARVSLLIVRDHPVLGVGRGNYTRAARSYVDAGLVHREAAQHSHPHNAYLEMMVSKGIVGLVVFLVLLLYPLIYFLRTFKISRPPATLGIIHIVGFSVFSLVDASTFIKGNYVSLFLLFLIAFFAWQVRNV